MAQPRTALLAVDLQPDFMPGGRLGVGEGDRIVEPIVGLIEQPMFALCVVTQDWHPPGHVSFASSHEGKQPFEQIVLYGQPQILWPDHCVQGTRGAALHHRLVLDRVDVILRKGTDPQVDSYSAFRNNWDQDGRRPPTGLTGYLRERLIERVVLCGLARDFCVKWSAEDSADAGFETVVLWDLTRPVDPASDEEVRVALERRGVRVDSGNSWPVAERSRQERGP